MVCTSWHDVFSESFVKTSTMVAEINTKSSRSKKSMRSFCGAFSVPALIINPRIFPIRISSLKFSSAPAFIPTEFERYLLFYGHYLHHLTLGHKPENASVFDVRRILQVILKLSCPNLKELVINEILPGYTEFFPRMEEKRDTFSIKPHLHLDYLEVVALRTGKICYGEVIVLDILGMIAGLNKFKMEFKNDQGLGLDALWANLGVNTKEANLFEKVTELTLFNRAYAVPAGIHSKLFPFLKRLTIGPLCSVKCRQSREDEVVSRLLLNPKQLEEVELQDVVLPGVSFPIMMNIKKLTISVDKWGNENLDFLLCFPNLAFASIKDIVGMDMSTFTTFFGRQTTLWNVRHFRLRELKLECKGINFVGIYDCFPNIQFLDVDLTLGNLVENLSALSRLPCLKNLIILVNATKMQLQQAMIAVLPKFTALHTLHIKNLNGTDIFPIMAIVTKGVMKAPKLSFLILEGFRISFEEYEELKPLLFRGKTIRISTSKNNIIKEKYYMRGDAQA